MITFLILVQLVLPLGAIAGLAIVPLRNLLGFWLQALMTAIFLFALARAGIWMFPPWWMPYAYSLLFILALIIGLKRYRPRRRMPSSGLGWIAIMGFVALGVFLVNEAAQSWSGQFPPAIPTVDLAFPLRGENYLILNGGNDIRVKVGDRIAEVGNSGASDEPHLHIHAQRPGASAAPFSGDPLPIRLNGRYLIRGDRVTIP
ncbi:MAG: M23 family metallopeptidase [Oculatellaceae cyanobacterium Prado106]|jgi:hypothetical protein|nr:M23 family metallopeptidase [Oculatellaceae cyanobacterium Prado106]